MTDVPERLASALADRYRIERELGAGGMATVYLAHDPKHDRKVAVKVLRPELAAVLGAERFLNEIKVTANLHHPHILPLHDSGEAEGFLYYVMPFVEGESLRDRIAREKQLPVNEAVEIGTQVAAALAHAHHGARAPPRCHSPRYQAGQHSPTGRAGGRGGFRDRAGCYLGRG
jgi:serine/threonine-protein kinase